MKNYDWTVIGGGIKGILAAHKLSKNGFKVLLLEKSNKLGGVLSSIPYKGFFLDLGCHLFDNINDQITKIMFDLCNNEMKPIEVKYKSKILNKFSDNFAVPDLSNNQITNKIIKEINELKIHNKNSYQEINYKSFLTQKYGTSAYELLDKSIKKITRKNAEDLSSDTDKLLPFDRIKIANEEETKNLKKNKKFSDIIASLPDQKKHYNTKVFKYRNFYPTTGGLLTFVYNSSKYLMRNNVDILKSFEINKIEKHGADIKIIGNKGEFNTSNIFWTSEIKYLEQVFKTKNKISDYIFDVPMVLYYFFTRIQNISNYTYITDYDKDSLIYRTSSSGLYGGQIIDGKSFICVEVPTDIDSPIWLNQEKFISQIWDEVVKLGQATGPVPNDIKIIKTPFSYKPLKYGYLKNFNKLEDELYDIYRNVKITHPSLYSKVSIAKEIEDIL